MNKEYEQTEVLCAASETNCGAKNLWSDMARVAATLLLQGERTQP